MADQENKRPGAPHRWAPGQSGNPKGRPRKGNALVDLIQARDPTSIMVEKALHLLEWSKSEQVQIECLRWLRDSGYNKPAERHEVAAVGADDDADEDLDGLDASQLRELMDLENAHENARRALLARRADNGPRDTGVTVLPAIAASSTRNDG